MACANRRDEAQFAPRPVMSSRPRAGVLVSNSRHTVIRLPHAADKAASSIADESLRRQRAAAILRALVERDVMPRLLAGASTAASLPVGATVGSAMVSSGPGAALPDWLGADDLDRFCASLLRGATDEVGASVERLQQTGVAADALCLHLLTGSARRLGEWWASDQVTFTDVTVASDQLERLFRLLAEDLPTTAAASPGVSAILTNVPGEQHSFGLTMLATFFRRAGWTVSTPNLRGAASLQRRLAAGKVDLLGFSLGAEMHLAQLGRCIELARRAAGADLIVMVGGPLFVEQPALARVIGADATAPDAPSAIATAEQLLGARRAARTGLAGAQAPS